MSRLFNVVALLAFSIGVGSLALTLDSWIGDWPREAKSTVDYLRSPEENLGRPPRSPYSRIPEAGNTSP